MSRLFAAVVVLPSIFLFLSVLVPRVYINRWARSARDWITRLAVAQCVIAGLLLGLLASGQISADGACILAWPANSQVQFSLYIDGVSTLMFALVSFVGWVICQYSIRYLDGNPRQGAYFKWTAFTVGAVSLMVLSGNLVMFVTFWILTSLGLHRLLLFYPHRPAAHRAAWTKFTISRIGDAALVAAIYLIYASFDTWDFVQLFAVLKNMQSPSPAVVAAGWLMMIGAVTKSAQFPFHLWLPQTMETPTPVSALMHAGIVNAGGYLIIRMSSLIVLTPGSMLTMAVVGGFTACFGAVVMLTQTSVKRSLAYSTIAQMGFMMLQCGLGSFSAAMLHILAHSLYKAHAFLSSGSVLANSSAMAGGLVRKPRLADGSNTSLPWVWLTLSAIAIAAFYLLALACFAINPLAKPGGAALGLVLCMALLFWVNQALLLGDRRMWLYTLAGSAGLCLSYAAAFFAVDMLVSGSIPQDAKALGGFWAAAAWGTVVGVVFAFSMMYWLQTIRLGDGIRSVGRSPAWVTAFYVHASNGFYFEAWSRRWLGQFGN